MPELNKIEGGEEVLDISAESDSIQPDETVKEVKDVVQETHSYTDDEQSARDQGWRPKDEFEGDPNKWVDADEFLRRGELFGKINTIGQELRDTKKTLRMLQAHHEQVRETEYKRALANLKSQKKQAYEEGDHDALVDIDDQLSELKAAQQAESAAIKAQVNQPDPRFVAWIERNSWYAQDPELRSFSDEVGLAFAKAYPDKDPVEVLKYVEKRVRIAYPDKFKNPNRDKPTSVGVGGTPGNKRKSDDFELSSDERQAMNTFVRQGIMTKEKYIEDLKQIRGIG